MKAGILTWYEVLNYGSVFQAYAIQEVLKENGADAEILLHDRKIPDYFGNKIKDKSPLGLLRWLRNQTPARAKHRKETKIKFGSFIKFRNDFLNVNDHYSTTDADVVFIGSDQIFDINGMYYPFQFGGDVSCEKINTYAPSFGETTYDKLMCSPHFNEISDNIKKLNLVNARDENTKTILENILNKDIDIVLDPTLLYSFKKEKEKWNKRLISDKYCLIYTWGGTTVTTEFAECCKKFASKNGLKLVSVGERRNWCDIQYASASPIEFFELFMHADMVLTNMFHGTCFSIFMGRPFYSFVMPHNENKLGGLLKFLNLEDQIVRNCSELKMQIPDIDYDIVNATLNQKREVSIRNLLKGSK